MFPPMAIPFKLALVGSPAAATLFKLAAAAGKTPDPRTAAAAATPAAAAPAPGTTGRTGPTAGRPMTLRPKGPPIRGRARSGGGIKGPLNWV